MTKENLRQMADELREVFISFDNKLSTNREYLDSDEGRLQVADYNLEKGFGFQQNRGKGKITKFLRW